VDQNTGRLTFVEFESASVALPGNFAIDPTGSFVVVANRNGNCISCSRINQETGALDLAGPVALVPSPSCIVFAR
jgi:6-phosphogluconolactonase